MGGDDQVMMVHPKGHQMRAHEGACNHIKRGFHLPGQNGGQRAGAVLCCQRRQIDQRHFDGTIGLDMHLHPVVREG